MTMEPSETRHQQQQRQVDELITQFKRKGLFDQIRRKLFVEFKQSPTASELLQEISNHVDEAVNRDPKLLEREKSKSAALIEGGISRKKPNAYSSVSRDVDKRTTNNTTLRKHIEEILQENDEN